MPRRVVVLGLDGATFDLIDPLVAEGRMPHLARLLREGTRGTLGSTFPPVTGPAWTSLLTGKRPENHGVLNFHLYEPGRYERRLASWQGAQGPFLWETIEQAGRTAGLFNVPLTWPPAPLRGFHVTGMLTPRGAAFTHPPELGRELEERFGYEVNQRIEGYLPGIDRDRFLRDLHRVTAKHVLAGLHLFDTRPCDFFMMVLVGADRLQHCFYHLFDRRHPAWTEEGARRYGGALADYYGVLDQAIGAFHARLRSEDALFLVSDHGFGPTYGRLKINRWLESQGWFTPRSSRRGWRGKARALFRKADVFRLRSRLPSGIKSVLERIADTRNVARVADWSRTRAYCPDPTCCGVYLNVVGRDPEGIVRPGAEYDALRNDIREALLQVEHPESGERLFPRVWMREEVYRGPFADRAPDVVFEMHERYNVSTRIDDGPVLEVERGHTGDHNERGILVACGESIRRGAAISGASIWDIAPTVLGLLDVPPPAGFDGRRLEALFEEGSSRSCAAMEETGAEGLAPGRLPADEQRSVEEELRSLGYL